MRNKADNNQDSRLRELFKASRFDAPPSPWFTKKVINRLPRKRARNLAWAEYALYAVAGIITAALGISYTVDIFREGIVRIGDIAVIATYMCAFCAIVFLCLSPWFRSEEELPMK